MEETWARNWVRNNGVGVAGGESSPARDRDGCKCVGGSDMRKSPYHRRASEVRCRRRGILATSLRRWEKW